MKIKQERAFKQTETEITQLETTNGLFVKSCKFINKNEFTDSVRSSYYSPFLHKLKEYLCELNNISHKAKHISTEKKYLHNYVRMKARYLKGGIVEFYFDGCSCSLLSLRKFDKKFKWLHCGDFEEYNFLIFRHEKLEITTPNNTNKDL